MNRTTVVSMSVEGVSFISAKFLKHSHRVVKLTRHYQITFAFFMTKITIYDQFFFFTFSILHEIVNLISYNFNNNYL